MIKFIEQHKLTVSVIIGFILCCSVGVIWYENYRESREAQSDKVHETAHLLVKQFQKRVLESINTLENLKSRIEVTNGEYFEFWEYDASLIVEQDSSFKLIEWIDSSMVVQRVEPMEGNEEAIGLDISKLDYRNSDWRKARDDSVTNFTHWMELVQGEHAFLVDAPVYFGGNFQGSITAGMDFTAQFNDIMEGLDQYHLRLEDENGTVFYEFGEVPQNGNSEYFLETIELQRNTLNTGNWLFKLSPNQFFEAEHSHLGLVLILVLGLLLSVFVSVLFFFMVTAYSAQKSIKNANEKLRALIESSPMAIYAIDSNGIVKDFWNRAAEEMLGWKREEVIGRFMPHVSENYKQDFKSLMKQSLEEGSLKDKEIERFRKDGSKAYFRLNVGHLVGGNKKNRQMLAILEDITKEVEYKKQLEQSVKEKEVLLSEVHHRVKNNLAIVAGLIELQKEGVNEEMVQILDETQNRIFSISGVHELLYNTKSFTEITFEEYAVRLIERIRGMFASKGKKVKIEYDFDTKNLNINQAIPLGLLINELITNSFKHAFEDQEEGQIYISLSESGGTIDALYKDNGKGFRNEMFEKSATLGATLIKTLISQLEADYTINAKNGFSFKFNFHVKQKGAHSNFV